MLPVTDGLTEDILSIPVYPALTDDEVDQVIGAVNAVAEELGAWSADR
jgi:dTDP-4-amino-4,6-dideoxygalactose transaminase